MMMSTMGVGNNPPSVIRWPSLANRTDNVRLHVAVLLNKPRRISKYVNRGVKVDAYNQDGQPPLFCAAMLGRLKIIKKLLKLGAEPNVRCREDGSTPVHAAAYIGCTKCLKLLLISGGDLRLTDSLLRTPLDWTNLQQNDFKQHRIKRVLDGARLCAFKSNGIEMVSEWEARLGPGKSIARIFSCSKTLCPSTSIMRKYQHPKLMLNNSFIPVGYGKTYYGTGKGRRCGAVIGIPLLNGIVELKLDIECASASWICGKFSTYVPMVWIKRKMSVTVRELRKATVEDAISDILIAELNSLADLQHPNILMLLAVCYVDNYDSISLVFEKVPLGSLHFLLHNQLQRLRSAWVVEVIIQICDALMYIHASGYLHGYVNSHAIFLIDNGLAKLGCCEYITPFEATVEDVQRHQHPLFRSDSHLSVHRHWVAPEILSERRAASKASDIYSLCSVMWELIHGEVPWKDYSVEALRVMMTENPYARLRLDTKLVPPLWYHTMKMGLEPEAPLRELNLTEIRDMMVLSRMKLEASRDHLNQEGSDVEADAKKLYKLTMFGPQTAV